MVKKLGVRYKGIYCGKLRRYFSFENFVDAFKVPVGIWQAFWILKRFQPDKVFSKGGFVSVPVVVAASLLKIPIILHESDTEPGLANLFCARYAKKICVSFEESRPFFKKYSKKVVFTGTPVREWLKNGSAENGRKFTGLNKFRPIVLVMGGSLGARQINDLVRDSLNELLKKFQIVHIRGRGNLDIGIHKKGYVQYEYLDEQMKDVYVMSEIVVSRGGANSLAEIAMLGKKAVIIPLGEEASRGDQIQNAEVYSKNYGWEVLTGEIGRERFIESILKASLGHFEARKFVNGTKKIVNLILKK